MDIYKEITDRIISQMENGIIPWRKTWIAGSSTAAVSYTTGKPYSLLNQMLLGRAGEHATFKQIQAAGGRVRKGEKASMIVFWKWIEQEDEETGEKKEVPFRRGLSRANLSKTKELNHFLGRDSCRNAGVSFCKRFFWRSCLFVLVATGTLAADDYVVMLCL